MEQSIYIRDVTARDGIQNEQPLSVEARIALIEKLLDAGIRSLEMGSFVRDDVVPAMASTAEVFAAIGPRERVTRWALVPNAKGAMRALESGADALSVTASASETYGRKNVGRGVDEAVGDVAAIVGMVGDRDMRIDAVISCCFGSPWEGDFLPRYVGEIVSRIREAGANEITLADTTGMATPRLVMALVHEIGNDIGFHFHDTRGTALVNAVAAMSAGVRRFDTSVGALGGSPFAVDAGGNLGTEDLLHLLMDFGIDTGIDFDKICEVSEYLRACVGHELNSRVALRGPRWQRVEP